jgi:membrane protease subunit HflC
MNRKSVIILGVSFAALFLVSRSLFIVNQTEQALVLQFGKPVTQVKDPGLHFKLPFLQNVVFYEKRIIDHTIEEKEIIAGDQKRLIVDAFVRYRIEDPLKFYQTVGTEAVFRNRLDSIVQSSMRQVVGEIPLLEVISDKRPKIMQQVTELVNRQSLGAVAERESSDRKANQGEPAIKEISEKELASLEKIPGFGVEVVDVRIKRADLPNANSQAIFRRMQTEREQEAKLFRAEGSEEAQRIRSQADKKRSEILADARKQSEIVRGEGDALATKTFAESFSRDTQFFEFYRAMQAYRTSINKDNTRLILSPDSEFLKYMD